MKLIFRTKVIFLCLGVLLFCANAYAGAMQDFNLIVLGNLTAGNSDVHGRTLVAGNIKGGTKDFAIREGAVSNDVTTTGLDKNDSLIVGGQILSSGETHVDFGGTRVGGSDAGKTILNSDYVYYNDTSVNDVIQAVSADIQATTDWFENLNATATETMTYTASNAAALNVATTGDTAVFELNSSLIDSSTALANLYITGNLSDVDMILIKVTGDSKSLVTGGGLHLSEAFTTYADKIVWYFPELESLKLSTGWAGSVVATGANFSFTSPIEGSVVVNNMTLDSEIHLQTPSWDRPDPGSTVPEPATAFLLGFGILAIAGRIRLPGRFIV